MLPSFRLIAATFLCGFVVVFAGLRMAASLNDIHEALPVMAAHAAPVSVMPPAYSETGRSVTAVPVMYDLRFAVTPISPILVRATPTTFERPAPLSIVPSQDLSKQDLSQQELAEPAKEPAESESTVAAIQPDAPVSAAPNPPASLDPPAAPAPSKPDTQAVAAVEPRATPELEASSAEPLIPESDTTASVKAPDQSADPAPAAVPTPAAKPKAAKPAPKAVANVVRKKSVRTANRAAPANNSVGATNPYGTPR